MLSVSIDGEIDMEPYHTGADCCNLAGAVTAACHHGCNNYERELTVDYTQYEHIRRYGII